MQNLKNNQKLIEQQHAKNPQHGDVIKRNLAEINAGIQTAGTRKRKIGGRKYGKSRKQKVKEIKK